MSEKLSISIPAVQVNMPQGWVEDLVAVLKLTAQAIALGISICDFLIKKGVDAGMVKLILETILQVVEAWIKALS